MTVFSICEATRSSVDAVTKYTIEDEHFGKNEVSVIHKQGKDVICVPSQTNCKMGCAFCHLTGTTRPADNLTSNWIASAVDFLAGFEHIESSQERNLLVSFMGVGIRSCSHKFMQILHET